MCARPLSCPLCSQPGFVTLDALRAGLVSVATRPLACPVCDETLIGIDKLTIHLFGHTINANNRNETRRDVNRNVRPIRTIDGSTILPRWNSGNAHGIRFDEPHLAQPVGDQIGLSPVSDSHSSRAANAAFNDNEITDRRCPEASKNLGTSDENVILSVHNSRHQEKFRSTESADANTSTDVTNTEAYEFSMTSVGASSNDTLRSSLPHRNFQRQSADNAVRGTKNSNCAPRSEEPEAHISDSWIENLLRENDGECSSKVLSMKEKNQFCIGSDEILHLSDEHQECLPGTSTKNTEIVKNVQSSIQLNADNSAVASTKIVFDNNRQTSINSKNLLLPQWKALRLLAMKEKTERCDVCGIHFPDVNFLVLHKQLAHMITEKDGNSTTEDTLKNCPCHLCSKVFKTRGTLMVHMRVAHMGYNLGFLSKNNESEPVCGENGFNCPTCGKNFKKEQHVTQHLKTHEGKQWECDVCSKMFTTKYFLKKHKRLHSGEMPYKCTICDKTFTFQQSYHKHRLYHKDDKPHTCGTCGRSFKELSTLHNHERIHTGEKPFACETCGKCFRQRVSYLVHRRIHTGVMPYKCAVCGKSFRYKVSQRTHKCPAQSEDSVQTAPEISSEKTTATPNSCTDCSTITKTEIFLRNPTVSEVATSETNKFILIVNTQGQPILTKELTSLTAPSGRSDDNQAVEPTNRNDNANRIDGNEIWSSGLSTENVSKDSSLQSRCESLINEKSSTTDNNDFFALVMSPMDNDISSPSTEMEHLRLSSPQNDDSRNNEARKNCETTRDNVGIQTDINDAIDEIFHDDCTVNHPLETINEESLKQLLYGMDRKV